LPSPACHTPLSWYHRTFGYQSGRQIYYKNQFWETVMFHEAFADGVPTAASDRQALSSFSRLRGFLLSFKKKKKK
jgi:hypothetical protein